MKHISSTQLLIYANCSRQYYFHYIEKIIKPTTSPHLIYGSSLHKVLEILNKSLISTPLTEKELLDIFEYEFTEQAKPNPIEFKRYTQKDFIELGKNTIKAFYKNHLNYEPVICYDPSKDAKIPGVEYPFSVPVINFDNSENEQYFLFGVIDLIAKVGNDLIVFDHKTSKDPYDDFKIQTSLQLLLYSYACRNLLSIGSIDTDKSKEDYVAFNVFVKDYKKNSPRIQQYKRQVSNDDITNLHYIINTTIKGIDNGIFIPNYTNCYLCDYREECLKFKYHGKK